MMWKVLSGERDGGPQSFELTVGSGIINSQTRSYALQGADGSGVHGLRDLPKLQVAERERT